MRCTTPPTVSTAGCRSRSTRGWRTTPTRRTPPPRALGRGRPAEPLHQDPGDEPRVPGDHDRPGRGDQRQRDADLRPGPLPGGHGGLRDRPRAGARQRQGPLADPLRGVVLRLTCRHRDRQAPRPTRRRPTTSRARPASPTRDSPTRPTRSSSPATAGTRSQADGANRQRPLWASTGVKNPDYRDTMYVDDLVVENTVNTMPEETIDAVARPQPDPGRPGATALRRRPAGDGRPEEAGVDYDDVIQVLERRGRREVRGLVGRAPRRR